MKVKMTAAHRKTMTAAHLFPNGLLVCHHEKRDKDAGKITFFTAYQLDFAVTGRMSSGETNPPTLVFYRGMGKMFFDLEPKGIQVFFNNGEELTAEKGVTVNTVDICLGEYALRFDVISCLDCGITVQRTLQPCTRYDDLMEKGYWNHAEYRVVNSPNCQ